MTTSYKEMTIGQVMYKFRHEVIHLIADTITFGKFLRGEVNKVQELYGIIRQPILKQDSLPSIEVTTQSKNTAVAISPLFIEAEDGLLELNF
jgi:hypothetical protein